MVDRSLFEGMAVAHWVALHPELAEDRFQKHMRHNTSLWNRRLNAQGHKLMFSSAREPAFAVYPDSDKIGAWSGNLTHRRRRSPPAPRHAPRRSSGH